jgi:hypothetical protein
VGSRAEGWKERQGKLGWQGKARAAGKARKDQRRPERRALAAVAAADRRAAKG